MGAAIACFFAISTPAFEEDVSARLPALAQYPLPGALAEWATTETTDYFDEIEPSLLGYLLWSDFPVKVYHSPIALEASPSEQRRQQQWQASVEQAIADWSPFLPLVTVTERDDADIVIERKSPPVQRSINPQTGETEYSFARNAVTTYQFYLDSDRILRHQITIALSPHQGAIATETTARHEIGHGLGIWGHSSEEKDVMYFSQTTTAKSITEADINTLKKIYQQQTRLGQKMP